MEKRYCVFCKAKIQFPFGGEVCMSCALDNKSGNYLTRKIPAKYCAVCGKKLDQKGHCVTCEKIIAQKKKAAKEEEKRKRSAKK